MDSLASAAPPADLSPASRALWFAEKGDLDRALALVTEGEGHDGAWALAHLRRASGDLANARYWYARAGRPVPVQPFPQERLAIVTALLADGSGHD